MKILMLSPVFPWPLDMGSKIRVYHILRELSRSHDITLVTLTQNQTGIEEGRDIERFCSRVFLVPGIKSRRAAGLKSLFSTRPYRQVKFQSDKLRTTVRQLLEGEHFDLVWVNCLNMASQLDLPLAGRTRAILDQHNADELFWRSYAESGHYGKRMFARQNIWKVRRLEKKILPSIDVVLSVSEKDAELTSRRPFLSCPVWIVPNGIDTEYFRPATSQIKRTGHRILFCGSMDITMNIDAARRFAAESFPIVREELPDAEFWIVGRNPDARVRRLSATRGVFVTGFVPDVRPYYEKAKVAVAPFRLGGGTKTKILEAMAMGVPVVASSFGCQGIEAIPGAHMIVEDGTTEAARQIVSLMKNDPERERLALNARSLVEDRYGWSRLINALEHKLRSPESL
jgi:sugar transferase (PEP-CTERM/EpsH1 system associated)